MFPAVSDIPPHSLLRDKRDHTWHTAGVRTPTSADTPSQPTCRGIDTTPPTAPTASVDTTSMNNGSTVHSHVLVAVLPTTVLMDSVKLWVPTAVTLSRTGDAHADAFCGRPLR